MLKRVYATTTRYLHKLHNKFIWKDRDDKTLTTNR